MMRKLHKFEYSKEVYVNYNLIEDIIVGSFEGISPDWLAFDKNDNPLFADKPKDMAISEYSAVLLNDNKAIYLHDTEDATEKWEFTIEMLLKGLEKFCNNNGFNPDEWDAESYDTIIQYALFGELVYG